PARDRRLDLRGRVDPDDRRRVVERVEVVRARRIVVRRLAEPRPDGDLRAPDPRVEPALGGVRVGADQIAGLGKDPTARPQPLEPAPDELDLVRRDELRRAEVEHDRLRRVEADLAAELLARAARAPLEPGVADRRAGDADPLARDAVQ